MPGSLHNVRMVENRGRFVKPCPGTPGYVCCGYRIIDHARGCSLGCSYCILKLYQSEGMTVYKNRQDLIREVESCVENSTGLIRFGTGEFTDGLLFERISPLYGSLIPAIARSRNAVLEIKTKTVNIHNLLRMEPRGNVIVSWSLNSEYAARNEEPGAPGIDERLAAAGELQEKGYMLAFHFDPIILHHGWKQGYGETIAKLFRRISPERIVYLSLGTLRYVPGMSAFLGSMTSDSRKGEFVRAEDNKMRYFRPLRSAAYRFMTERLSDFIEPDRVYLCMENSTVWEDVFDVRSMNDTKLAQRLDEACRSSFRLS